MTRLLVDSPRQIKRMGTIPSSGGIFAWYSKVLSKIKGVFLYLFNGIMRVIYKKKGNDLRLVAFFFYSKVFLLHHSSWSTGIFSVAVALVTLQFYLANLLHLIGGDMVSCFCFSLKTVSYVIAILHLVKIISFDCLWFSINKCDIMQQIGSVMGVTGGVMLISFVEIVVNRPKTRDPGWFCYSHSYSLDFII